MIGTTNVISKKGEIEKLILTLKTNQASNNDLSGVAFTLEYGSFSKDYVWSGESIDIDIPGYMEYTVTFKDVEGYATPEPITEMAVAGSVRAINAIYKTEIVSVTVNAINGESVVGQTATINGTEHTWNGTAITQKVPFGTTYEVSVNDKKDYVTPESQSFTANQAKRSVFMQYVDIPVTDLSKVDIYGNPVAQNTANCYVIKEPGKYMFPIVYGAGIKNGEVNPTAYTNNGAIGSRDFVNYLGNVITSPYVETDTATQVTSVQISISDMDNAVTGLEIVEGDGCRYIKFEVPEVPTVGANAVISVKDSSDVIMWNWHLWLWEDDLAVEEITNATNVKYKILPYNLGSKWDDTAKTKIKNWFWQWGRPVPLLCPAAYNSTSNHASYGTLNFTVKNYAQYLYEGIQNPTTFYCYSLANYNWFAGQDFLNLWDAACTYIYGNFDNEVIKTVYDPCPVGFKIPNGNTFSYFSIDNVIGSFNVGWKFKRHPEDTIGVFFPGSGFRNVLDGSIQSNQIGRVWYMSSYSGYYAYVLLFGNSDVDPHRYGSRAFGHSVRPVQDSALNLPTHKLTISITGDSSIPSGYEVKVYSVIKTIDETTGEVTETLGDVLATQTTDSSTHELTWGTRYRIVASDVNEFITPESLSYIADVENRDVSLVYVAHAGTKNPSNGVYIQDTDGYFHTETEWTGEYTPNGIAVITSNCRFVMALEDAYNSNCQWGNSDTEVSGITTTTDVSAALADYDGEAQTTTILNQLGNSSTAAPAAYYCRAYTFPNGKKGYLGAAGEWETVLNNFNAIVSTLVKCGGSMMLLDYWTSTQYDSDSSWWSYKLLDKIDNSFKTDTYGVRAFCSI